MVGPLEDPITLVELGSGSGEKVAMLAEALRSRRHRVLVHLIDISPDALELSERTLGRFEHISVVGHRTTYEEGLRHAARDRPAQGTLLVVFFGSNIGNFDPPAAQEFLREIRRGPAAGRRAPSRRRSRQAREGAPAGLRRSVGRDGRVQQERARADQHRAAGRLRPLGLRPPGRLERRRAARRDAAGLESRANGPHSARRLHGGLRRRASGSGPRAPTSTAPTKSSPWSRRPVSTATSSGSNPTPASR